MALFSRRFWTSLLLHDRRLVTAVSGYERAARRYRASRDCVTSEAQMEFRMEFLDATRELRAAVADLRAFHARHGGGCDD